MKGFLKRVLGQKGFTLVELLIVFTLLGVLAAIMIPNVSGLIGYGHQQAADAELSIVQTAMDSMMAKEGLATVTATSNTSDMSGFPANSPLYPEYVRFQTTNGRYTCTTNGTVSQDDSGF
jgi:prepilin-type N-terminal cleavage/methylation domain-containing protein